MNRLLLFFLIVPTIVWGQKPKKEVVERVNYFKTQPIFVTQLTLDEKVIATLGDKEVEEAKNSIDKINSNIRTTFTTFWDINDSVIFILDNEINAKKKEFREAIFFEVIKLGEYVSNNKQIIPVTAFRLSRPDKSNYFKNVLPRPGIDSSLVNTITEVRQLKLNVTTGEVMNEGDLGMKTILINKDDRVNKLGESYVKLIRSKYSEGILEVDNRFVLDVIMRKDPRYIYLKNGATFNAEDGSMIPLN